MNTENRFINLRAAAMIKSRAKEILDLNGDHTLNEFANAMVDKFSTGKVLDDYINGAALAMIIVSKLLDGEE